MVDFDVYLRELIMLVV